MAGIDNVTELRTAKWDNNEPIGIFCLASPSVTYKSTPTSSTDPFSGKTNKYAESKVVRIATDLGCHIEWSADGSDAATTSSTLVPAGAIEYFSVDESYPYLRVIEAASGAVVTVSEVY